VDRGYVDYKRLYAVNQAGVFFVTRSKEGMDARRVYSHPVDRATGLICDQRVMLNGFYSAKNYPEHLRRIRFKDPESGKALVFLTNNTTLPALAIAALYKSRWQIELFFKWKATPAHQALPRYQRERRQKSDLVRSSHLCADRHRQKGTETRCVALHLPTDFVGVHLRENRDFMRPSALSEQN
jgi:Transposase DDE domain